MSVSQKFSISKSGLEILSFVLMMREISRYSEPEVISNFKNSEPKLSATYYAGIINGTRKVLSEAAKIWTYQTLLRKAKFFFILTSGFKHFFLFQLGFPKKWPSLFGRMYCTSERVTHTGDNFSTKMRQYKQIGHLIWLTTIA